MVSWAYSTGPGERTQTVFAVLLRGTCEQAQTAYGKRAYTVGGYLTMPAYIFAC